MENGAHRAPSSDGRSCANAACPDSGSPIGTWAIFDYVYLPPGYGTAVLSQLLNAQARSYHIY
jgi:hypothetical protein